MEAQMMMLMLSVYETEKKYTEQNKKNDCTIFLPFRSTVLLLENGMLYGDSSTTKHKRYYTHKYQV